uniref:trypsin n=2 Tax=Phlebotominae TaxID=7198 RepID=A0A6B2EKJ0_9DIPT
MLHPTVILGLVFCLSVSAGVVPVPRRPNDLLTGSRIVGGNPVDIKEIPYQVSVNFFGMHYCGGSILNERFILTAAHCTEYARSTIIDNFQIRTGSNHSSIEGQVHRVKELYRHELYNPEDENNPMDYDYAILELEDPIVFDDVRRPVQLATSGEEVPSGTMLKTSGWGATKNIQESTFHVRAVSVPAVSHFECASRYYFGTPITERMICAGYSAGGKDACQGDSGGPIIREDNGVLVGVVSWGNGCALPGYPGVYSKVSAVREWIAGITGL